MNPRWIERASAEVQLEACHDNAGWRGPTAAEMKT